MLSISEYNIQEYIIDWVNSIVTLNGPLSGYHTKN